MPPESLADVNLGFGGGVQPETQISEHFPANDGFTPLLANGIPTLQRSFTEWVVFAEVSDEARRIANGHAKDKHKEEFAGKDAEALARIVEHVMKNGQVKRLKDGRSAYWDGSSRTIVIKDPANPDGGTVFKPTRGKEYFNGLK